MGEGDKEYGKKDENISRGNRLLFSGALGISVLSLMQLLQLSSFDTALVASLYCFMVSIPFMSMAVYVTSLEISYKKAANSALFMSVSAIGAFATLGGVIALSFHFAAHVDFLGWWFILMCAIAVGLTLYFVNSIAAS